MASNRRSSVMCSCTPPHASSTHLENVGTKYASRNRTPGSVSALSASAQCQSRPGAPMISNGRVVPRPSEKTVPSNMQVPG